MKPVSHVVIGLWTIALLFSCQVDPNIPEGTIVVDFPTSRSFEKTMMQESVDFYTIAASDGLTYRDVDATWGSSASLAVPVGTYTVLAFVGHQGSSGRALLGTGKTEAVVVERGVQARVTIQLNIINYSLTVPSTIGASTEFEVSNFPIRIHGNLGLPELAPSNMRFQIDMAKPGQIGPILETTVNFDGESVFDVVTLAAAPNTQGIFPINWYSGSIYFKDGVINERLGYVLPDKWSLYASPLYSDLPANITVDGFGTGIGIALVWKL